MEEMNSIIDQALKDEYKKLERKGRTVENMVNMAVSRELSKDNTKVYSSIGSTTIPAIKNSIANQVKKLNECCECNTTYGKGKVLSSSYVMSHIRK